MFNKVTLIGKLSSTPYTCDISDGIVYKLNIITDDDQHHSVLFYETSYANIIDNLILNELVYIEGRIRYTKWMDINNVSHTYTDIIANSIRSLSKIR